MGRPASEGGQQGQRGEDERYLTTSERERRTAQYEMSYITDTNFAEGFSQGTRFVGVDYLLALPKSKGPYRKQLGRGWLACRLLVSSYISSCCGSRNSHAMLDETRSQHPRPLADNGGRHIIWYTTRIYKQIMCGVGKINISNR